MTDPLLLDVPVELTTERLVLRAHRPGDGARLAQAVGESLDRLRPWLAFAQAAPSPEDTERYVRRVGAQFALREVLDYGGYLRAAPERFVLACGFHTIDWAVPRLELGYWVRTGFEGRGLMREAVQALVAMAFDRLFAERLEIRCDADNVRSAAVARAAGFRLEGRLRRQTRTPDGRLRDTLVFARLRGEEATGDDD
jgi:RimJ/RimL family protein N-acetyltransferase